MAEFMGKDGFVWWQGVVEDRYDPLYLGRCRIRILGWHTEDKTDMPTESLPWAYPVQPIISAAQTGVGISPTGPVEGTWVVGFYRDGEQAQEPVFFGTLGGIPSLDSKSIIKGLFSGAIGLWLATIGYDAILGVERFVFNPIFSGGINIIAALVGLFAIPQVLSMLESKQSQADQFQMEKKNLFESFKYNISRIKALIVGSVTGTIIGLIPGAGGQIAGLVSYAQIKKTSSNKENFGKGEPDGIIAAESANNAMVGPSLVPLLTLGVPGSPTAAVLLGGLLIHGLFPGSNLFTVYAETTWTFINSLLVAQFMMLIFGLYISGLAKYVMKTPTHYMAAAITILAIFGTYSVQHNFADVIVMLFLGTTMFFLSKFGFTAAPIVLGIILGPIAETNFNQAKIIADTQNGIFDYLTSGPLNLTIIALCLISILYGVYGDKAKRGKK